MNVDFTERTADLRKPWAHRVLIPERSASLKPLKIARPLPRWIKFLGRPRVRELARTFLCGIAVALVILIILFGCETAPAASCHLSSSICHQSSPGRGIHGYREKSGQHSLPPKSGQAIHFNSIRAWHRAGSPLPMHSISHDRNGRQKIGTADAYGEN
jgi:hypothetical protein